MRARYEIAGDIDPVTIARLRDAARSVEIDVVRAPAGVSSRLVFLDDGLDDRQRALLADAFERLRRAIERDARSAAA
jgi:hypothetical protein